MRLAFREHSQVICLTSCAVFALTLLCLPSGCGWSEESVGGSASLPVVNDAEEKSDSDARNGELYDMEATEDTADARRSSDSSLDVSSLMVAARQGDMARARELLRSGMDVDARNELQRTALIAAAEAGHLEMVQFLTAQGADVNAQDFAGRTALMQAAEEGHPEVTMFLLERGVRIDAQDRINGWTAVRMAVAAEHLEVVELLVANGADIDVPSLGGITPLMHAADKGHASIVELLLANEADIDAQNDLGVTPLMAAADKGHASIVELLLANDADFDAQDNEGLTALMIGAGRGHRRVVEHLLAHGASIDLEDAEGVTAADFGVVLENWEIVDLLDAAALARIPPKNLESPWLMEAWDTVAKIGDGRLAAAAMRAIVEAQASAGRWHSARWTAQQIGDESERDAAMIAIANAMVMNGNIAGAIRVAESIENDWSRDETLSQTANTALDAGRIKGAIRIAGSITDSLKRSKALVKVAIAAAMEDDRTGVRLPLEDIENPTVLILEEAMDSLMGDLGFIDRDTSRVSTCIHLLTELHDDPFAEFGVALLRAAITVMHGKPHEAAPHLHRAERALEQVEPGFMNQLARQAVIPFLMVVQAFAGDLDGAKRMLEQIEDDSARSFMADFALPAIVEQSTMWTQVEAGEITAAMQTARAIDDAVRGDMTLRNLAMTLAVRTGDVNAARTAAGMIDDATEKKRTLISIAEQQLLHGDPQGAVETVGLVHDMESWRMDSLLPQIATAHLDAGEIAEAIETADGIVGLRRKAEVLVQIAVAQGRAGQRAAGRMTRQVARQIAAEIEYVNQRAMIYRAVAAAAAIAEDESRARTWIAALDDPYLQAMALVGVAEGVARRDAAETD